jgi:PAS domain S-box-containing protein
MATSSGEIIYKGHPQKPKPSKERIANEILESIGDYVSAFDRNWNIIYINKATAKDFGFKPEKLLGKNFWKKFPDFLGTALEKNYREAMAKRVVRRFEWKTIYAGTGYKEFTVFPCPEGITVYGHDITERKKAEEELYKNRELLNNIIDSTDSVIIARTLDEKLILLNRAQTKLYNMTAETALGTTPHDIYSKEVADRIVAWDRKVFTEGKSFQYEETVPINGKLRTYVTNKFPLRDSDGKIYGLGGVITDITHRKKMENQLKLYNEN